LSSSRATAASNVLWSSDAGSGHRAGGERSCGLVCDLTGRAADPRARRIAPPVA